MGTPFGWAQGQAGMLPRTESMASDLGWRLHPRPRGASAALTDEAGAASACCHAKDAGPAGGAGGREEVLVTLLRSDLRHCASLVYDY